MPKFEIIEARPWHVGQIVRIIRREHMDALDRTGANPHRELNAAFASSFVRKAWLVDGKLAALGGVCGSLMETEGVVWIAASKVVRKYPVHFVKATKSYLDQVMTVKTVLRAMILTDDETSLRFACFMGFHPQTGYFADSAQSQEGRKYLVRHIKANEDIHFKIGGGSVVSLAYEEPR